jgi:mRNA interferase HigB
MPVSLRGGLDALFFRGCWCIKKAHPKASILKAGRVVFNIKANDYRLIAVVQYENGVMMIRFFGSHEEYDQVDAETV